MKVSSLVFITVTSLLVLRVLARVHKNDASVLAICVFAVVLGQSQKCFFQTRAGDLKPRERLVTHQQCADDWFGFAGMDLYRLAILLRVDDAGNLQQTGQAERGDAADALAAGLG